MILPDRWRSPRKGPVLEPASLPNSLYWACWVWVRSHLQWRIPQIRTLQYHIIIHQLQYNTSTIVNNLMSLDSLFLFYWKTKFFFPNNNNNNNNNNKKLTLHLCGRRAPWARGHWFKKLWFLSLKNLQKFIHTLFKLHSVYDMAHWKIEVLCNRYTSKMMEVQNQYFLKRLTLLYPNYITQFYTLQKVTKIVTLVTFCSELKAPFFFPFCFWGRASWNFIKEISHNWLKVKIGGVEKHLPSTPRNL